MKLYLDDERPTPKGWVGVKWPQDAIALLQTNCVSDLSLDHDLGDDERGTGYDVLTWIEEQVYTTDFTPPARICVHSANPSARIKMELAIGSIARGALHSRRNTL